MQSHFVIDKIFFGFHVAPFNKIVLKSWQDNPGTDQMSIPVVYGCKRSIFDPELVWISIFFNEINLISKAGKNYLQNLTYSSIYLATCGFCRKILVHKVAKIVNKIHDSVLDNVVRFVQKKTRHKSLNYLNLKIFRCKIRKSGFRKISKKYTF